LPRILKIPLKDKISFPTRHIRLEFDHATANYYIEIDTIKLYGHISPLGLPLPMVSKLKRLINFIFNLFLENS